MGSSIGRQRFSWAIFEHASILQYKNVISACNCGKPVCDHNSRTPRKQLVYRSLDQVFRGGIEARRSLIQNDKARIDEEDAGKRQQLSFASREARTIGPQLAIQASGEGTVPGEKPYVLERFQYPRIGNGAIEKGQVVAYGGAEELDILGDHDDMR